MFFFFFFWVTRKITWIYFQVSDAMEEATPEEGWVVCRIFKKKLLHRTLNTTAATATTTACSNISPFISVDKEIRTQQRVHSSSDEGTLEQIFQQVGSTWNKQQNYQQIQLHMINGDANSTATNSSINYQQQPEIRGVNGWKALDQLVASHLIGQISDPLNSIGNQTQDDHQNSDFDLWSFMTRGSFPSSNASYNTDGFY